VKQNASGGTDHGKANNLFLMGGKLQRPGIFNKAPDLSQLDDGDVQWEIVYRQVYATLLDDWLGV
ncbi:MAG: twin-arginine translocation pathway signal, partial [Bacteroidota bacterium]